MKIEDTEALGWELKQARSKPDTVDRPIRTARTFVYHRSYGTPIVTHTRSIDVLTFCRPHFSIWCDSVRLSVSALYPRMCVWTERLSFLFLLFYVYCLCRLTIRAVVSAATLPFCPAQLCTLHYLRYCFTSMFYGLNKVELSWIVPFPMIVTLSDWANYSMTSSIARSLCDSSALVSYMPTTSLRAWRQSRPQ